MSTGRQPEQDRRQCTPCRGTGRLISAKGGTKHEVTCPWCGGSGRFQLGRDAQSEPAEAADAADAAGGAEPAGSNEVAEPAEGDGGDSAGDA